MFIYSYKIVNVYGFTGRKEENTVHSTCNCCEAYTDRSGGLAGWEELYLFRVGLLPLK